MINAFKLLLCLLQLNMTDLVRLLLQGLSPTRRIYIGSLLYGLHFLYALRVDPTSQCLHVQFTPRRQRQLICGNVLHFLMLEKHVCGKSFQYPFMTEALLRCESLCRVPF